ncbi:hypothetical protein [Neptuniibacter sp. CAU 1671]|uniref:hypothetical protein n=1 Tax=Neptuniibacter sp. CAU 1671 TaxID=3032593 RepID=UPI0023DA620D|nr:hypothetical protein [Neptuniibacter sp. CAU 1671]MDF2180963.1 hypothetical protein [Neptuniibacter sp. CAU 1671]
MIIGDSTRLKVLRDTLPTEAEAKAAAEAEYRKLQRGGSTLNVTLAEGDARLYPETPIIASGYKPEIDAIAWAPNV